tara:strand:+ start:51 stop:197 length:147 start_codon:yes stop_codon:yes gene_type:complete
LDKILAKQLPSHAGLASKMDLQKQIKNAMIKGDFSKAKTLQEQLRKHK